MRAHLDGLCGGELARGGGGGGFLVLVFVGREAEQLGQDAALLRSGGGGDARLFADHAGIAGGGNRCAGRTRGAALLDVGERERIAGERLSVGRDMDGAAVREDAGELVVRHARPVAHAADVHVDEGARIEADAAALEPKACDAQLLDRNAGNLEVDRLAEHVLAELGDAARAPAQHRVGGRRAVRRDDVDRLLGLHLARNFPQDVEQLRVHPRLVVVAPVAQEIVELFQAVFVVAAVALERDGDVVVAVGVAKVDGARVAVRHHGLQRVAAHDERKGRKADRAGGTQRNDQR